MLVGDDPWRMFVEALLAQSVMHFALVGALFWLVWKWGAARFRAARIQARHRVNRQQLWFETKNTLATLAFGTGSALLLSWLYAQGATRLYTEGHGWHDAALGLVGFLVWNDLWFYAWHRLMHHPRVFRYVHAVHHKSVDVNPFSTYSFHPVEALIFGSAVFPWVLLVPTSLPVLGVAQVIGLANNLMSHLGYEFLPRWYNRIPPFRWMNTSTFHNLHHTQFRGNYGLLFRVWDKVFGTELPDYERTFLARGAALHPPAPPRPAA